MLNNILDCPINVSHDNYPFIIRPIRNTIPDWSYFIIWREMIQIETTYSESESQLVVSAGLISVSICPHPFQARRTTYQHHNLPRGF